MSVIVSAQIDSLTDISAGFQKGPTGPSSGYQAFQRCLRYPKQTHPFRKRAQSAFWWSSQRRVGCLRQHTTTGPGPWPLWNQPQNPHTESSVSRIPLQSPALILQTAEHRWSLAEAVCLTQERRKSAHKTPKWGRARVTAAALLITGVAVLIPVLLIKRVQSYITLTWHASFQWEIGRRAIASWWKEIGRLLWVGWGLRDGSDEYAQ